MGLFDKVKSGWDDAISNVSKAAQKAYDASLPKLITTGRNTITDKAGEAWSKAVDDTGVSKTLGDAGQAVVKASIVNPENWEKVKDAVITVKDNSIIGLVQNGSTPLTDAAGEAWSNVTEAGSAAVDTVTNTVTNVKETVKDTVHNVTQGVTEALPIVAIGAAAVLGLALLFGRR